LGNSNNKTTPIDEEKLSVEVTVTDPRHPLFGQTFPVLETIQKSQVGTCLIVQHACGLEQMIPQAATDRSEVESGVFPLPVNLASLEQLLTTYERIIKQLVEEQTDESSILAAKSRSTGRSAGSSNQRTNNPGPTGSGVEPANTGTVSSCVSDFAPDLPVIDGPSS
jgi:hypothetical protein